MIKGRPRADGLAIMEILHVSFLAGAANPKMRARIAFVKSDSGSTLGYAEHENWSRETLQALATLRDAMERDVAQMYLEGHGDTATTDGGGGVSSPQGIQDHLGQGDAPSV